MRVLALGIVLAATSVARAEPFVELGGGLTVPLTDDTYTSYIDPSANLFARFGGGGPTIGGMASVEWSPLAADSSFLSFNRFRILGHIVVHHLVAPKVELTARAGAGLDILHEHAQLDVLGTRFEGSDTDVGLALEFGGGIWFSVGAGSTQVGAELALPISYHSKTGNPNNPNDPNNATFDFTGLDLDVLAAVRLRL